MPADHQESERPAACIVGVSGRLGTCLDRHRTAWHPWEGIAYWVAFGRCAGAFGEPATVTGAAAAAAAAETVPCSFRSRVARLVGFATTFVQTDSCSRGRR